MTWAFIHARYKDAIGEPKTWTGLDGTNARIRAWLLLREFDPEYAAEIA